MPENERQNDAPVRAIRSSDDIDPRELTDQLRGMSAQIEAATKPMAAPAPTPEQKLDPVLGFDRVIRNRRAAPEPPSASSSSSSAELDPVLGIAQQRMRKSLVEREFLRATGQEPATVTRRRSRLPAFDDHDPERLPK